MKILALLLVAVSLIAAGCGSGDNSANSGGVASAPPKMDDPRTNPQPATAQSNP